MIAPPSPLKIIAFYDTECFHNYWLLKLRVRGGGIYTFKLLEGGVFAQSEINSIRLLFDAYEVISFNGNFYDVPMIAGALSGYNPAQLKWLNDQIIVQKLKPWELNLPDWKPANHIDIMQVAPGDGGQKQYAGRIHYKTMRDLPYSPDHIVQAHEIKEIDEYCENDLNVLEALFDALRPQISQRERLSAKYDIDLRSKSDAQLAEAVLKKRCEIKLGRRIYKPEIEYHLKFRYKPPAFIAYGLPQLQTALTSIENAIFTVNYKGEVVAPPAFDGLTIAIGSSVYALGIGGLHSQEKCIGHVSDEHNIILDNDVASYYPTLILNSGAWPPALGEQFLIEYGGIKTERLAGKALQGKLKKLNQAMGEIYEDAQAENEGGKIMINGTFGKTGSPFSVLYAPQMMIQTTVTGQLSLLMLIEWHEYNGIPVISANTDGIIIKCPRDRLHLSKLLIAEWEKRTGLEMETVEYAAVHSRDINNYFAIKTDGDVKRKGEYSKAGLLEKKNPDVEICGDAVAEFLARGTPILHTIVTCTDIRKFVTIQRVAGGAVKMWGHGPIKGTLVRDMVATLTANGWVKDGRKWRKGDLLSDPTGAYKQCFAPQHPEPLGKVIRWYYSTQAPGPIVYASNGNLVGGSYGAHPLMVLPEEFPLNIDYEWYLKKCERILVDIGYSK